MKQEEQSNRNIVNNQNFVTDSIMGLRLDTSRLLNDVEAYLRGGVYVTKKKDGQIYTELEIRGEPKVNSRGVQGIMSMLRNFLSPSTVQGNFDDQAYQDYIFELDVSMSRLIMENAPYWEIKDGDYNNICDMIILTAIPFFSRLKNNLERESYFNTMQVRESTTQSQSGLRIPFLSQ